jgi:hypothetical protein
MSTAPRSQEKLFSRASKAFDPSGRKEGLAIVRRQTQSGDDGGVWLSSAARRPLSALRLNAIIIALSYQRAALDSGDLAGFHELDTRHAS